MGFYCPLIFVPFIKVINVWFKLAIMRVAAIGLANIACSAGKPFGNRAIYAVR